MYWAHLDGPRKALGSVLGGPGLNWGQCRAVLGLCRAVLGALGCAGSFRPLAAESGSAEAAQDGGDTVDSAGGCRSGHEGTYIYWKHLGEP